MANGVAGIGASTGAGTVASGAGLEQVEIVTRSGWRGYSDEDKARLVESRRQRPTGGKTLRPGVTVASLIKTCKLNGVDPQRYLTDLLTRLVQGWPQSRIDEFTPWCWPKADQA